MLWVYYFFLFDSALSLEDNEGTRSGADSLYDTALLQLAGGGEYYIPPHKDLFSKVIQ
jgi:hypothetical protein